MRPIAYVAGPYTADTTKQRDANVNEADCIGRFLLSLGYAPFIPHKNTYDWELDFRFDHSDFMEADLAILKHADILVLTSDWANSKGTQIEVEFAKKNGIPVFAWDNVPKPEDIKIDITKRVVNDLYERRRIGVASYGETLKPFNGRDSMQDVREELLDAIQYATQFIIEQSKA